MRILTYKRTHTGDPDNRGVFGSSDCMGSIRDRAYDAVVGIGSRHPCRGHETISGKVTWVGIGPIRTRSDGRGFQISFERFLLLDGIGPDFESEAPNLARRFYVNNARAISHSYSKEEKRELEALIKKLVTDPRCRASELRFVNDKLSTRRKKCKTIC